MKIKNLILKKNFLNVIFLKHDNFCYFIFLPSFHKLIIYIKICQFFIYTKNQFLINVQSNISRVQPSFSCNSSEVVDFF